MCLFQKSSCLRWSHCHDYGDNNLKNKKSKVLLVSLGSCNRINADERIMMKASYEAPKRQREYKKQMKMKRMKRNDDK